MSASETPLIASTSSKSRPSDFSLSSPLKSEHIPLTDFAPHKNVTRLKSGDKAAPQQDAEKLHLKKNASKATVSSNPTSSLAASATKTRYHVVNEKQPLIAGKKESAGSQAQPNVRLRLGSTPGEKKGKAVQRPVLQHTFITDGTDMRNMEQSLLQLLEDFHVGKLRAFGQDCSMEEMEAIRAQQERLARLHFELGAQQELYAPLSSEGLRTSADHMRQLVSGLERLSLSIERLHSHTQEPNRPWSS